MSAKASSYNYTPKADTENNIVDKEGCSVLYSLGVRADLKGKLEIAQLDKGKVDAEIQSSYQNAVSNFRSNRTYAKVPFVVQKSEIITNKTLYIVAVRKS